MFGIYNLVNYIVWFLLQIIALINPKIKLFVKGRKESFSRLNELSKEKKTIWIHVASLGEFEQGRPIIEVLKKEYPTYQILVTFFSPSGYEIRKNYKLADVVCYLPFDTKTNVQKFVSVVNPTIAIFIKYEFWPNYLKELGKQKIVTILISGIFREEQIFFKSYGVWMKKSLHAFSHFFVQDETSGKLLNHIGLTNITLAGDTRFDRVQKLIDAQEKLDFIEAFVNEKYTIVVGSSWKEDEEALLSYINKMGNDEKMIIAPHNIHVDEIQQLKQSIKTPTVLFSEREGKTLSDYQVFIVDTIGILSKIYRYADVAYIGGGYNKSGVHNTLEAATYGVPIVIGPNYNKFKEVIDLVTLKGCTSTHNAVSLQKVLSNLKEYEVLRKQQSEINRKYVKSNLGATDKIMRYIEGFL